MLRVGQLGAGPRHPTKSDRHASAPTTTARASCGPAPGVFATGKGSASWLVRALLTTNLTMGQIFKADPAFTGTRDFTFASKRTNTFTVWMDPYAAKKYYHSLVGRPNMTAASVRAG